MRRMEEFFKQWQEKVEYDMMNILVERERFINNLHRKRIDIEGE
jgi:hypothetical protein